MTWYFDPSGTTMDVFDHTGAKVREDYEFSGAWSGQHPDAIPKIMREEAEANSNVGSGNAPIATEYAVLTLLDWLAEDIEKGTPDSRS
jgi:hypothetical protein